MQVKYTTKIEMEALKYTICAKKLILKIENTISRVTIWSTLFAKSVLYQAFSSLFLVNARKKTTNLCSKGRGEIQTFREVVL